MYHTTVTLKKGEGRTLKAGGMWIYDNEIESIMGAFENGDLVNIHDFDGYFMGYGFLNMHSKSGCASCPAEKNRSLTKRSSNAGYGLPGTIGKPSAIPAAAG